MSDASPVWRAILWAERFLPKPGPIASDADRAKKARHVAWLPFVVALPSVMPVLVSQRHELAVVAAENRIAFEQLALIVAGGAILATIVAAGVFGTRAWRDARGAR